MRTWIWSQVGNYWRVLRRGRIWSEFKGGTPCFCVGNSFNVGKGAVIGAGRPVRSCCFNQSKSSGLLRSGCGQWRWYEVTIGLYSGLYLKVRFC